MTPTQTDAESVTDTCPGCGQEVAEGVEHSDQPDDIERMILATADFLRQLPPGPEAEVTTIDMDEVVRLVQEQDVDAYVEQTGGGCATIFAGPTHEEEGYGTRFAVCAGPGWFAGQQYTEPQADAGEFYIGPDDSGEAFPTELGTADAAAIAAEIVRQVRA